MTRIGRTKARELRRMSPAWRLGLPQARKISSQVVPAQGCSRVRSAAVSARLVALKSEGRNPKSENGLSKWAATPLRWLWIRPSDFGFLSAFGLRVSDLARPACPPRKQPMHHRHPHPALALPWLWCGFRMALGWLWGPNRLAISRL